MTGRVLVLAVAGCLLGCSGPAAQQASTARSPGAMSSADSSAPSTTPVPSPGGSSPVPAGSPSPGPTARATSKVASTGSTGASSAPGPRDQVAVQNCRNTQEAYRVVVTAVNGPEDRLRVAATEAGPPPVDTNATTAEGRTATRAILALQDSVLQVAAQGAPAVPGLRDRLAAVRSACAAVGAAVFPA